jgi:long-chain acyl-CoA synthetase
MLTRQAALDVLTAAGQAYELQTIELKQQHVRIFKNAPESLRVLFADTQSDNTFIVFEHERLSFAQAYQGAARIAQILMTDYGVVKGDRVAIAMRNYPEWILAFTAITSIGAIAVAMNAWWQPDELAYGLRDSDAKVLFADQERLDQLAPILGSLTTRLIAVRSAASKANRALDAADELNHLAVTDLHSLMVDVADAVMPAVEVAADDAATIFYTSGSTGHPKGVLSSHRNIISALLSWELDAQASVLQSGVAPAELGFQQATLLVVPLFHVTGSHAAYLSSYRAQRKIVCMYKWDSERAALLIEREKITSFIAPAAISGDLVRVARNTQRDLGSLVAIGGGGAPRAPEQVRQIDESFAQAQPITGWGMSETNAIGTGIGGPDYLAHPASSGRCSAVLELKVIADDGSDLPSGARGELLVRGTSLFIGYWRRPELNASAFEEGWFRTGDVAYFDDEGYLYIVDRIKDLIIRGGENIGCGQVEAALLQHPDVYEVAVYALPDERLGEEVAATIHGNSNLDINSLREFLSSRLARFEIPRYIFKAVEPLPRTASGKILKRQLRDLALLAVPDLS